MRSQESFPNCVYVAVTKGFVTAQNGGAHSDHLLI